jgi:hypothetical protein
MHGSAQRSAPSELFLVELASPGAITDELTRMHRALGHAVARQSARGAEISLACGLLIPGAGRCLCLLEARDLSAVVAARDVAGLRAESVLRAYRLTHPGPSIPPDSHESGVRQQELS